LIIKTANSVSRTYVIGLAVTHIYGVEVTEENHNLALLKMDNWLRGDLPAAELAPKIRSSDLKVIGLGVVADGMVSKAPDISEETRTEMAARGKLPEAGWLHLLPVPASGSAQIERADGEAPQPIA
jgi:hypothetical protein